MSYAKVYRTGTRINTLKTEDLVKAYTAVKGKKRNAYTREYNRRVANGSIKIVAAEPVVESV